MAKTRSEYSWTQVENYLLEALAAHALTGLELRVSLVIIRETLGWKSRQNRNQRLEYNQISYARLIKSIGASERGIREALKGLLDKNIVTIHSKPSGKTPGVYGINGKIEEWGGERQGQIREKRFPLSSSFERNQSAGQNGFSGGNQSAGQDLVSAGTRVPVSRNQSAGQAGTRVPVRQLARPGKSTGCGASNKLFKRNSLKETLKRNSLNKEQIEGGFVPISSPEEAKKRTNLSGSEALLHATEFLRDIWGKPPTGQEVGALSEYFQRNLEPRLLLANLISATEETVEQNRLNKVQGLRRFTKPIEKTLDTANASLSEKLQLARRGPRRVS